jgi:hypothetical protein
MKRRMQDLERPKLAGLLSGNAAVRPLSRPGTDNPNNPSAPALNNSRRLHPTE